MKEKQEMWSSSFIESFNKTLHNECLKREIYTSVCETQKVVETWRGDYNEFWPHNSLGYLTPAQFTSSDGRSSPFRFHLKCKDKGKNKGKVKP